MTETNTEIAKKPEWRWLVQALRPVLEYGRVFTYDELSVMAGIDITTTRGRSQFWRAARTLLVEDRAWFENERGLGYRVVKPDEQAGSVIRQARAGTRRYRRAVAIAVNTKLEALTAEQRRVHDDVTDRAARTYAAASTEVVAMRRAVGEVRHARPELPRPL